MQRIPVGRHLIKNQFVLPKIDPTWLRSKSYKTNFTSVNIKLNHFRAIFTFNKVAYTNSSSLAIPKEANLPSRSVRLMRGYCRFNKKALKAFGMKSPNQPNYKIERTHCAKEFKHFHIRNFSASDNPLLALLSQIRENTLVCSQYSQFFH